MEISSWLAQMQARILQTFGERVAFIGLQGSFARGEAGPDSDIDLVVILDAVVLEDLERYRALLEEMPLRERSCGFIAGHTELLAWPRYGLFQFFQDTRPIYGELEPLLPPIGRADVATAIQNGAAALYHALAHAFVHEDPGQALPGLYKAAFFILQAELYLETGFYPRNAAQMEERVSGARAQIFAAYKRRNELEPERWSECYGQLLSWSSALMQRYRQE